jgi:Transglycosylase-like domain
LRRLPLFALSFAIAAPLFGGVLALPSSAQVAPPPAGAGQPSSFVIDANQAPTVTTTVAPPVKKKSAKAKSVTPTTIDVRPLDTEAPATASTVAPAAASGNGGIPDSVWAALRKCESNGNYAINTGNGYYGAYQFAASTWRKLGYSGLPHEASPAIQDEAARKLQASAGWGPWPACTRKLGLR